MDEELKEKQIRLRQEEESISASLPELSGSPRQDPDALVEESNKSHGILARLVRRPTSLGELSSRPAFVLLVIILICALALLLLVDYLPRRDGYLFVGSMALVAGLAEIFRSDRSQKAGRLRATLSILAILGATVGVWLLARLFYPITLDPQIYFLVAVCLSMISSIKQYRRG